MASAIGIAFIGGIYFYFNESSPDLSDKIESYRISMYADVGFPVLLGIALYVLPNSKKASPQIVKTDGEQVFQKQEIVHHSIKSTYEHFKQG